MSYDSTERGTNEGQPIECYLFSYNDQYYTYTSSQYAQQLTIDGHTYAFSPTYIERGDTLKLGDSGGTVETCIIKVLRTNNIALLYQGAPPELDTVRVTVFRFHALERNDFIRLIVGTVSQVRFKDSTVELTITIENVLNRYIPRGTLSYNCQNCIYDEKCRLIADDYVVNCDLLKMEDLSLFATDLRSKPSGYFTDGYMKMGNSVRAIVKHEDNMIIIKYPINNSDKADHFTVYPGCNQTFAVCARRFSNTDNFNAIPYIPPYNVYKHNSYEGRLPYWINGNLHYFDTKGTIYTMGLG